MPRPSTTTPKKDSFSLSTISTILSLTAGLSLLALLIWVAVKPNYVMLRIRPDDPITVVEKPVRREVEKAETPIGVVEEYAFTITEGLAMDTFLGFYTVHQYADVYLDGQLVYSLGPSAEQQVKTIGSNWSFLPIYREDAGKEARVEITPVYESIRGREVEFLLGSRLTIYTNRLKQDLPQLALSVMSILVGIVFVITAVLRLARKQSTEGLAWLGLFSILLGLFRLSDTRFTPFLLPEKPVFLFYMTVEALMIGAVPLMKSMQKWTDPTGRRILECCCLGTSGVCIGLFLLQVLGGIDFRNNYLIIHTTLGINVIVVIASTIYDRWKHPSNREPLPDSKALILLMTGVLADITTYYVQGNSSRLVYSLLSMFLFILFTGIQMLGRYAKREQQFAEKDRILAETERQLTESRIATMISQIRPHFIYNTLGSIEQLCELQPEKAAQLVHEFACYLRGNFGEMDNPAPIRLSQEMAHVRHYVSIEKIRFPDMEVQFDLRSSDFLIPALSVQPLVENAIKHGLMKLPQGGTVVVSSHETDTHYCVTVADNGPGFDTAILREKGSRVGLRNIHGRITAMCGGTLTVESTPGLGTKVQILIPKEENP